MAARIIDGKKVSEDIRSELKKRVAALKAKGVEPGLAVVLVGDDPASVSYVTGKERACEELGIRSHGRHMPASSTESEVIKVVSALNADPAVHGILVQIPLPKGLDERRIISAIDPGKDMDGLTPENVGRLVLEEPGYLPCTPAGVIELLRRTGVETRGARAVIVGRSSLVGRPLANLMIRRTVNATVTLCHTATKDLADRCREADILVACAGAPNLIRGDWIKPGACVIDVGMSRVEDAHAKRGYRLVGDVAYAEAAEVAGWITPVPGGVGPMTVTMLLANTVEAAEKAAQSAPTGQARQAGVRGESIMLDVQSMKDERRIPIQKVGVKGACYPIVLLDKAKGKQHTTATVSLFADLPHDFKGTHMSRFLEVFESYRSDLSQPRFLSMLEEIRQSLEAETAYAELRFPYFVEKAAPVSGALSMMSYDCGYIGKVWKGGSEYDVSVSVPVQTVCPCSKAISQQGAHNQRGLVTLTVALGPFFWIEDLIALVEDSASTGLYTILKREDEKYVTERAFDNPRFVEDVVREVYRKVEALGKFPSFSVEAENYESIHNHSAYAYVTSGNIVRGK